MDYEKEEAWYWVSNLFLSDMAVLNIAEQEFSSKQLIKLYSYFRPLSLTGYLVSKEVGKNLPETKKEDLIKLITCTNPFSPFGKRVESAVLDKLCCFNPAELLCLLVPYQKYLTDFNKPLLQTIAEKISFFNQEEKKVLFSVIDAQKDYLRDSVPEAFKKLYKQVIELERKILEFEGGLKN